MNEPPLRAHSPPLAAGIENPWGLARTSRLERPEIRVSCIECELDQLSDAVSLVSTYADENEFSIDKVGGVRTPKLQRCDGINSTKKLEIRADATYLISGGQGALERWLV